MRMFTIPNQSGVAKAFQKFDEAGRMRPSPYYEQIVGVVEELVRFTVLLCPHVTELMDRYSERKAASAPPRDAASALSAIAVAHQRRCAPLAQFLASWATTKHRGGPEPDRSEERRVGK